jgi:hypothetical protein
MNNIDKLKEFDGFLDDIFKGSSLAAPKRSHAYSVAIALRNRGSFVGRAAIPDEKIASVKVQGDIIHVEFDNWQSAEVQLHRGPDGEWPIVERVQLLLFDNDPERIGAHHIASAPVGMEQFTITPDGKVIATLNPYYSFESTPF